MLIDILKKSSSVLFFRLIIQKWQETVFCWKYMSAGNLKRDAHKLTTELTIIAHALEKGMSIGHVRPGFGKIKASNLILGMQTLIDMGGEIPF